MLYDIVLSGSLLDPPRRLPELPGGGNVRPTEMAGMGWGGGAVPIKRVLDTVSKPFLPQAFIFSNLQVNSKIEKYEKVIRFQ